nr:RNA-directed DNA polymerase, eukaryota, reverse transcriptase zinc-binding domain protein [Tanacetum cinerariifolium]
MEKKNVLSVKNVKAKYKDELEALEAISDKGDGNVEVVNKRIEVVNTLQKIDKICSSKIAQKAKVKWSIEGDENTSFFMGEFFHHFSSRFDKLDARWAHIEMRYPKTLTCDQKVELESDVSNEEIQRAVWDCGIDKSLGPDVFTFGFYRRSWNLIENDVYDAVKYFFTYGVIPKGCNSSFIALIVKIPDANTVKDFRPISLIGSFYKIVAKILANRLAGVLGDIVNEVQSAFIAGRQILDGPFFHHWIEMEGFSKFMEERRGKARMEKKNVLSVKNVKAKYKDELEALEAISDKGDGNVEVVNKRIEVVNTLQKIDKICSSKIAQKAKGIMVDGMWIESPNRVKGEVFHHFSSRFDKLDARWAHIEMRYPKTLTCDQKVELESDVSNEEIQRAVWDCGIDKSPGPDVFLFGFYRRSWNLIEMMCTMLLSLKQGDPLSLFLFILIMESLHLSFQRVVDAGIFKGIKLSSSLSISHIFYVDDAVFVVQWCDGNITTLVLKVGGSMSRVHTWNEMVDQVKNWLSKWKMKTLSIGAFKEDIWIEGKALKNRYSCIYSLETCNMITM